MTRIVWGKSGERLFEAGVDRGVLYLQDLPGVPWNGLTAVSEAITGGEAQPFYYEGYKYLNLASAEEFGATITAYSAPLEFGTCDGTIALGPGLFITQQPRKQFNISYRTLVGNDIRSTDHGYKIHLVYNALAAPSNRSNQTVQETTTAAELSWAITTVAPRVTGRRPTAHFVIDSTLTPPKLLSQLENILYGTELTTPRMPTASELIEIFTAMPPITRKNFFFGAEGRVLAGTTFRSSAGVISGVVTPETYVFNGGPTSSVKATLFTTASYIRAQLETAITSELSGKAVSFSAWIKPTKSGLVSVYVEWYNGSTLVKTDVVANKHLVQEGVFSLVTYPSLTPPANVTRAVYMISVAGSLVVGDSISVTAGVTNLGPNPESFFSGSTPSTPTRTYSWEGVADTSVSIERSWY